MHPALNELQRRLKSNSDPVVRTFDYLKVTLDGLSTKSAELEQNDRLTLLGRMDALKSHIADEYAANILFADVSIGEMAKSLDTRRRSLLPEAVGNDPRDIATASEIRSRLHEMTPAAQAALLLDKKADPRILQAVLSAPAFLTRVSDELRSRAIDLHIDRTYPGALARLEDAEESLQVLRSTKQIAFSQVGDAIGFPLDDRLDVELVGFARAEVNRKHSTRGGASSGELISAAENQWANWSPFADA